MNENTTIAIWQEIVDVLDKPVRQFDIHAAEIRRDIHAKKWPHLLHKIEYLCRQQWLPCEALDNRIAQFKKNVINLTKTSQETQ